MKLSFPEIENVKIAEIDQSNYAYIRIGSAALMAKKYTLIATG